MVRWWKDLSVSKKLYSVVGVMALLIATELFTLLFAMDILSAVRTFVGGEGLWSKAQKNAIYDVNRYLDTQDVKYWDRLQQDLEIPHGDHQARMELEKPVYDYDIVKAGFVRGGNHPDDIKGMVKLIRRFHWVSYIGEALQVWRNADIKIEKMQELADQIHVVMQSRRINRAEINRALNEIESINVELTSLEGRFSFVLGQGSRWLEGVLMALLILAVLTVESTGLFLTITFSRTLNRSLQELMTSAQEVGRGNFLNRVPVRSKDELGQLATAINKMNDDLENNIGARRLAESASQIKSMFLANMSHEIRTPLGVMVGLAEILKDRSLSWQDHLRYVETIERTGKSLTRIINDILDLSKVEAGHLDIEKSRFLLSDFLNELQSMLSVQALKTENQLIFMPMGPQPEYIVTDRTRLRQILVNLVNNALKFTHNGSVTLKYSYSGKNLIFDVIDTGAGISDQGRQRLFQPFSRGEAPGLVHSREGTGLGLVLSQRLARAMGGDVQLLRTEVGKGTTFRAQIESNEAAAPAVDSKAGLIQASEEKSKLVGRHVLVVEDSEDNQMLVRLYLTRMGIYVDFAENGREGVKQATERNYDLVLMDMQMPVMDGYRATQVLRENGYIKPIIALTAHAMKEDRDRCMKVGCDDYLTKPIDSTLLYSTLLEHITL